MAYRSRNPFQDEEDDKFENIPDDPEIARMKQEKEFYQQQMIDSSLRSLQLVQESQDIASETGAELRKQREQLERTNKNLDKITGDLNQSDRHITALKSVWGTISTWFKKPLQQQEETKKPVNKDKDDFLTLNAGIQNTDSEIRKNLQVVNQKTDLSWDDGGYSYGDYRTGGADEVVNRNLDNLSAGLAILKQQGLALGAEIDEHNDLIEAIQGKVATADVKIERQTKQINKIIK